MESTMQGIVGAAFEGAGVSIGSLVGGAVYKSKVIYNNFFIGIIRTLSILLKNASFLLVWKYDII